MNERRFGMVLLVFTTFFWGSTFILVKRTVEIIKLDGFITIRFITAALILLLFVLPDSNARRALKKKTEIYAGMLLGALLYVSFWFQTEGLVLTTPSKAAFITGLNVVLVPILGYFFHNRINRYDWIASVCALIGLALLSLDFNDFTVINLGDLMIIVTAFCVALHVLYTNQYTDTNPATLVFYQLITVSALSFFVSLFRQSIWVPSFSDPIIVWITLVVTAGFASAFAFLSQTFAQKKGVSSAQVAIIFALEPIFALLIDIIVGTQLNLQLLLGMMLILAAMLVASTRGSTEEE